MNHLLCNEPSKQIVLNDKIYMSDAFNQSISDSIAINQSWNTAIDTMMEVIELHPLIDYSTKVKIKEIAKGLRK